MRDIKTLLFEVWMGTKLLNLSKKNLKMLLDKKRSISSVKSEAKVENLRR